MVVVDLGTYYLSNGTEQTELPLQLSVKGDVVFMNLDEIAEDGVIRIGYKTSCHNAAGQSSSRSNATNEIRKFQVLPIDVGEQEVRFYFDQDGVFPELFADTYKMCIVVHDDDNDDDVSDDEDGDDDESDDEDGDEYYYEDGQLVPEEVNSETEPEENDFLTQLFSCLSACFCPSTETDDQELSVDTTFDSESIDQEPVATTPVVRKVEEHRFFEQTFGVLNENMQQAYLQLADQARELNRHPDWSQIPGLFPNQTEKIGYFKVLRRLEEMLREAYARGRIDSNWLKYLAELASQVATYRQNKLKKIRRNTTAKERFSIKRHCEAAKKWRMLSEHLRNIELVPTHQRRRR